MHLSHAQRHTLKGSASVAPHYDIIGDRYAGCRGTILMSFSNLGAMSRPLMQTGKTAHKSNDETLMKRKYRFT